MNYKKFNIEVLITESEESLSDVPCETCIECCKHLSPLLTQEEVISGKYIYSLIETENPNIPTVGIPRTKTGCIYLINNECSIYDDRPKSCRQFDCRKGHYLPFKNLVKEKFNIDI